MTEETNADRPPSDVPGENGTPEVRDEEYFEKKLKGRTTQYSPNYWVLGFLTILLLFLVLVITGGEAWQWVPSSVGGVIRFLRSLFGG